MVFKFIYPTLGIEQIKIGIPHDVWEECKTLYKHQTKESDKSANELLMQWTYGMEWFTTSSPLFEATYTEVLKCNGVELPVKVEFLGSYGFSYRPYEK